jgi:hypothetical protein
MQRQVKMFRYSGAVVLDVVPLRSVLPEIALTKSAVFRTMEIK